MMQSDEFSWTNTVSVECVGGKVMRCFSFTPDQLKQSPVIMMFNQKKKQVLMTPLGKDS